MKQKMDYKLMEINKKDRKKDKLVKETNLTSEVVTWLMDNTEYPIKKLDEIGYYIIDSSISRKRIYHKDLSE